MSDLHHALGYLRTSSATNVGDDKDSDKRQKAAIERGAAREGFTIVDWFYDADVKGDIEIADRPGFSDMLDRIEGNGVRVVFVEGADRFARKMLTSELGIVLLVSRGVRLMTATGEDLTNTDDEMRVAFRQIAMAFSQLEKTRLVKKLKGARDRASVKSLAETGKRVEGVKGYTRGNPELVALAKSLMPMTLLAASAALADRGYRTANGLPFSAAQVKRLIEARIA
jgi:DNA invertase Pin-like site-specific DNA recombinase